MNLYFGINDPIRYLLDINDWKAKWIEPGFTDTTGQPSPMFRKQFSTDKKIKSAAVFITAHGLYGAKINGHRVDDDYLLRDGQAITKDSSTRNMM